MGGNNLKWFIIVSSFAGIVVSLNVSCTDVNQQPLTCRCQTTNNVEWYKNGTKISGCTPTLCFPSPPSGYELTPSANLYTIEIAVFDDSFCSSYSCKDVVNQASEPFPVCVEPTEQPDTTATTTSPTTTTTTSPTTTTTIPTTTTTTSSPATTTDQTSTNPATNPANESTIKSLTSPTSRTTKRGISNGQDGDINLPPRIISLGIVGGVIIVLAVPVLAAAVICRRFKRDIICGDDSESDDASVNRHRQHSNEAKSTSVVYPGNSCPYRTRPGYNSHPLRPMNVPYVDAGNRYDSYSYPRQSSHIHDRSAAYEGSKGPKVKQPRQGYRDYTGYTMYPYRM